MAANQDSNQYSNQYSNPNHNSPAPEGAYDPAGSTQMFRAFVEEAAPARQAGPARQQRREAEQAGSSNRTAKLALVVALVLAIGAAAWFVLS
ncbi:hypothetical protein [Streptomyces sp. NPDC091371]|uniref:hypothetical protein n=1 Tax=Streptomyces sp. NPDC091371 TaxID=3155303 RepID=UPI00341F8558